MALRFFLEFDEDITTPVTSQLGSRTLWQAGSPVADVAGLVSQIRQDFAIPAKHALHIAVHGYTVPPGSLITLLRDNDRLQVFHAASRPALQLTAAVAACNAAAPPALQGNSKRKRAANHAADLCETGPAMRKGPIAVAAAPAAASAERAAPQQLQNGTAESASSDDESEDDEEEDAEAKQAPSRSARRKKLKRRLRREGVLPSAGRASGARDGGHRHAGGGGPAGEENMHRAPQQQLPKRGEVWAMSRAEQRFASKGHVYFSDSDAEQRQPGSKRARAAHAGQPGGLHERLAAEEARAAAYRAQQQATKSNGHAAHHADQPAAAVSTRTENQQAALQQQQQQQQQQQESPSSPADFEALAQLQQPAEGAVVGYRLLHIGADWTPQVSEWRKGRVVNWHEGTQMLTVEPWPDPSVHPVCPKQQEGAALGDGEGGEEEEDEDEGPPTEYEEDGMLCAALHSFHDLRLIRPAPQQPLAALPGVSKGEQAGAPDLAGNLSDSACDGQPQSAAALPDPAAQEAAEETVGLPDGAPPHAASAADRSSEPAGAMLIPSVPNPGPPTPGGPVNPSNGSWISVAAELRRRRAELAAQQEGPPCHSSGAATPVAGAAEHASSNDRVPRSAGIPGKATEPHNGSAQALPRTRQSQQQSTPEQARADVPAAAGTGQRGGADVSGKGAGSSVNTPGAVKPRPGVRASSVGLFLARLRAQDAEAVSE